MLQRLRLGNTQTFRVCAFGIVAAALGGCDLAKSPTDNSPATPQYETTTTTTTSNILIRPTVRYQTITGWEATSQTGYELPGYQLYKDSLFTLAVNDLGITRLRVPVASGAENTKDYYTLWRKKLISDSTWRCERYATVNDNSDPNVINWAGFQFSQLDTIVNNVVLPMRQKMIASGQHLFLNLTYVAFTSQICAGLRYIHTNPQEYAEFILAASLHLKNKYGLTPDSWEVILEPDNTSFWRGPQIGAAIVATAAKLTANGFAAPRFITPSTARSYNAVPYFDAMVTQVPGAVPYMRELSYHRYSSTTITQLQTIASRATRYGIQSSMLEHIGATHLELHNDLKYAHVSAWQQFALAYGLTDDGSQYYLIDRTIPSSPKIIIGSRTKYLRQYFRYVRPGAVRIDATSSDTMVDPLAFINSNGNSVVVLTSHASAARSFSIQALPAGTYGSTYTNGTGTLVTGPNITITAGQVLSSIIPAKAVMTIYQATGGTTGGSTGGTTGGATSGGTGQ